MRIEAQGKYLQSILEKAKETLAGHTSTSPSLEAAHAELTELATKVSNEGLVPSNFQSLQGLPITQAEILGAPVSMSHLHLPRQVSRGSDSSSQRSYLTNLTAGAEDSGGVSRNGEAQVAAGRLLLLTSFKPLPVIVVVS